MRNSLDVYNLKQRIFLVKTFYQNDGNCDRVRRRYLNVFSQTNDSPIPTDEFVSDVIRLFEATGSVLDFLPLEKTDPQIDLIFFANDLDKAENLQSIDEPLRAVEMEEIEFDENLFDIPHSAVSHNETSEEDSSQYDPYTFMKLFDKHQNFGAVENSSDEVIREAIEKTLEELEDPSKSLEASLSPLTLLETPLDSLEDTIKELEESLQRTNVNSTSMNEGGRKKYLKNGEKKKTICEVCGKEFANKSRLEHHMTSHMDGKPHQCPHCEKCFKWTFALSRHLKLHEQSDDEVKLFKCQICGKTYKFERYLKFHIKNIHEKQNEYKCKWCKKSFISQAELLAHWKTHNEGIFLSDTNANIARMVSDIQCAECGKIFRSRDSLKKHMSLHTGNLPYTCEICGKGFIWKEGVRRHLFKHLGIVNETSPVCNICGKRMSRESALKAHMNIHQKPEHPFQCPIDGCGKSFPVEHCLKRHIKERHTARRFKCSYCHAEYKDKSQLQVHIRRIHMKEEAPYTCSICKKDFWVKRDFRIHLKKNHNNNFVFTYS
ncbi:hypothetical protein DMENIID0001_022740 [Sergentomyia squamirostris]